MDAANSTTHINSGDLVSYLKDYYNNIISSQLQANYGRVFIQMGESPSDHFIQSLDNAENSLKIGFDQALYEKRKRELRDKVSFDSFSPSSSGPSVIAHGTALDLTSLETPTELDPEDNSTTSTTTLSQSIFSRQIHQMTPKLSSNVSQFSTIQPLQAIVSDAQLFKGKSLHLGRDVEFNDVVFAERPLTSLSLQPEYIQCCDNCLRPLTSLEEQIWSLLMGGEKKTSKATGPADIMALLDEITPLKDVINEYISISSVGDDDFDNFSQEGIDAIKNGKLTADQFNQLKQRIGEELFTEQRKHGIVEFYTKMVLKQYNHVLKKLHTDERLSLGLKDDEILADSDSTAQTNSSLNQIGTNSMDQAQRAVFDVIDVAMENNDIILDLNEVEEISIFEPSTRLGEIMMPVYSPYNDNMYCSLRCFCISYNNYDHILTTAHPLKSALIEKASKMMEIETDSSSIGALLEETYQTMVSNGEYDTVEANGENDGDDRDDGDDEDGLALTSLTTHSIHSKQNKKAYPLKDTKLPTTKTFQDENTNKKKHIVIQDDAIKLLPGELTTSKDMLPGPSGLPFLPTSQLYNNLIQYTRLSNPMFLDHIRGITQSIAYWGMKMVNTIGGDYSDIISLLSMQADYVSVEKTALCIDLVNYDDMLQIHNIYLSKLGPHTLTIDSLASTDSTEMKNGYDDAVITKMETRVNVDLDTIIHHLSTIFNSNIQGVLDAHAKNVAILQKQYESSSLISTNSSDVTLFSSSNPEPTAQSISFPSSSDQKKLATQCYCTACLSDLSYSLLQYSLFPHLMFTQTQWFTHVHDSNGDNYFSHMAKELKKGPGVGFIGGSQTQLPLLSFGGNVNEQIQQNEAKHEDVQNTAMNSADENASLFSHQISLLHDLQTYFEPIIVNYMRVMSVFISLITRLYPICYHSHRTFSPPSISTSTIASTTSTGFKPSPYFVELLASTSDTDPTCILSIPSSSNEVKELMNDIPHRVAEIAHAIQRPLDCCNWLVLSLFVSSCEMNNIEISPKSGVVDLLEFLTISDILNLDPEDLPEAQEQLEQMYQAALNVWIRQNGHLLLKRGGETDVEKNANPIQKAQFKQIKNEYDLSTIPDYLYSKEKYMDYVLGICGKLMGTKGKKKKLTSAINLSIDTTEANSLVQAQVQGDSTKAWNLLVKRVDSYPEASGLFRISCTMNHSCSPNCAIIGLGDGRSNLVAIVALRDIKAGEELTISYIDEEETYKNRQNNLSDYQFKCECSKCIADLKRITTKKTQVSKTAPTKTATANSVRTTSSAPKSATSAPKSTTNATKPTANSTKSTTSATKPTVNATKSTTNVPKAGTKKGGK